MFPNSMKTLEAPISSEQLLDRLEWRYATKKFDPSHTIDQATWDTLEEALRLSPSSGGLQPWAFAVVTDPAVRGKLVPAAHGQTQVRDASHLVVFAARNNLGDTHVDAHIRRTAEVRGVSEEDLAGYRGMLSGGIVKGKDPAARQAWAARQTYIALGTLLTSAALLGVDACPMEGFDPAQVDAILGLKEKGLSSTVMCALGYRSETDAYARLPKVRFKNEEVVLHL